MARNVRIKENGVVSHVETGYVGVGTSHVQISSRSRRLKHGVTLKSPSSNTHTVFVSEDQNMTTGSSTTRSGYPIQPGDTVTFPVDDISKLWLVSDQNGPTNISYFYG
jgi:hypothetical protein